MSLFETIQLDYHKAESELAELKSFLQSNQTFSETAIIAELKKRLHLSSLIGSLIPGVKKPNRYKFEFSISGVFRADLVVGSSDQRAFVFVEFEDGNRNSLFGPGRTNQLRDWSRRLEHGFGQLIDWAWAIQDGKKTTLFRNAFGCDLAKAEFLLVCGRDSEMDQAERERFDWRSTNITVAGTRATTLTFDGLFSFLEAQIEAINSFRNP